MKITVALFSCCLFLGAQGAQEEKELTFMQKRAMFNKRRSSGSSAQRRTSVKGPNRPEIKPKRLANKFRVEKLQICGLSWGFDRKRSMTAIDKKLGMLGAVYEKETLCGKTPQPKDVANIAHKNAITNKNGLIILTGAHHYLFSAVKGLKGVTRKKETKNENDEVVSIKYPNVNLTHFPTVTEFIKDIKKIVGDGTVKLTWNREKYDISAHCMERYLLSLTNHPDTTKIAVIREVQRHSSQKTIFEFAKPAWVSGIMQVVNKRRTANGKPALKYIIDFGTDKMALTNSDGGQPGPFYVKYIKKEVRTLVKEDKQLPKLKTNTLATVKKVENGKVVFTELGGKDKHTIDSKLWDTHFKKSQQLFVVRTDRATDTKTIISMDTYLKELKTFLAGQKLTFANVEARFTGNFRNEDGQALKKAYTTLLTQPGTGIKCGGGGEITMAHEAKFGSQHTLNIVTPYIKEYNYQCGRRRSRNHPIEEVLILESGSGSIQGYRYDLITSTKRRRLASPFGIEVLENLLDECREAGYPN